MAHKAWKVLTIWPLPEKVCQPLPTLKSLVLWHAAVPTAVTGCCVKLKKGQRLFILKPSYKNSLIHSSSHSRNSVACQLAPSIQRCKALLMLLEVLPILGSRGHLANGIRAALHNTHSHLLPESLPPPYSFHQSSMLSKSYPVPHPQTDFTSIFPADPHFMVAWC